LNDLCLALLPAEQPEGELDIDEIEEEQLLLATSDGQGQPQYDDASASAEAAGAGGKDAHEHAVTAQLSNMAASLASLSAMFLETRNDVAQLKAAAAAVGSPQVSMSSVCVPSSQSSIVPVPAVTLPPVGESATPHAFIPTIASLRADPQLAAQAEQLADDVTTNVAGNSPLVYSVKRGIVRCGGDLAPKVKVPCPHDFVLGSGRKLKLYYEDLSMFEWVNGYIATIQNEPNAKIACYMMSHMRNLMEDAVFHGWEPVKQAHADILSSLESGEFSWCDEIEMAERRCSAINRATKVKDSSVFPSGNFRQGAPPRGQNRPSFGNSNGNSNVSNARFNKGRKLIKACVYFNNGACNKHSDHDEGNVYYRHICLHCMSPDHVVRECNFLTSST
jgi:hypothetical protein